jgi:hypothetical protein
VFEEDSYEHSVLTENPKTMTRVKMTLLKAGRTSGEHRNDQMNATFDVGCNQVRVQTGTNGRGEVTHETKVITKENTAVLGGQTHDEEVPRSIVTWV